MIKIEKSVPAPSNARQGITKPPLYPFREMNIGDSFWLPGLEGNRASEAARKFSQRNPEFRLTVKKDNHGYRIWRISNPE